MHQFILGKAPENYVIDHKDNNGLNNMRDNLHFATEKQNSQNKQKKDGGTSQYIGVYFSKQVNKWISRSGQLHLGSFNNEKDAAILYDKYALLKYGEFASTNNLVKYDDIKNENIDLLLNKKERELPKCIYKTKTNMYYISIQYKNNKYNSTHESIKDAEEKLKEYQKEIENIKLEEDKEHNSKPIIRNEKGEAVLTIKNIKGEIIEYIPVSDERWHELTKYSWHKKGNYYVNGNNVRLNRYLMDAKPGQIVDHINNDKNTVNNNKIENLRINTRNGNSHNKKKKEDSSSQYLGVSYCKRYDVWKTRIKKRKKRLLFRNL